MKISRVTITNYRGISAREITIGEKGFTAKGRCGSGKTSILGALRAALIAQDVGPDAIKHGADKAEILIDLDDVTVRRIITAKASKVTVTSANGFNAPKPQAFLNDLFQTSAYDPIDIFKETDKKKRRAKVFSAFHCACTREQLAVWAPDMPADTSLEGHGIEVVARLAKVYYDRRTIANKVAEETDREANRLQVAATEIAASVTSDTVTSIEDAKALYERATAEVTSLTMRAEEARKAIVRTASSRERISKLRGDSRDLLVAVVTPDVAILADQIAAATLAATQVRECEERLRLAREELLRAQANVDAARAEQTAFTDASARSSALAKQADELESALSEAKVAEVTDAEHQDAQAKVLAARLVLSDAERAVEVERADAAATAARAKADTAKVEASRLDATVKRLTNDAPAELLKSSNGLPGLSLDGDDIVLDGVVMDKLCGAEQLDMAIEIARRLNVKSKVLIVDGLERIDGEMRDRFVAHATRDGYMLLATRVARGDIQIEAIELDDSEIAAE